MNKISMRRISMLRIYQYLRSKTLPRIDHELRAYETCAQFNRRVQPIANNQLTNQRVQICQLTNRLDYYHSLIFYLLVPFVLPIIPI